MQSWNQSSPPLLESVIPSPHFDNADVYNGGMQSALYSCALYGDAGPVAAGGAVTGCTSANLPDGYVVEETRELSQAKTQHVQ